VVVLPVPAASVYSNHRSTSSESVRLLKHANPDSRRHDSTKRRHTIYHERVEEEQNRSKKHHIHNIVKEIYTTTNPVNPHLTNSPMHTLRHRPLVLVLLMRLCAHAAMRMLDAILVLERLPDLQVDSVAVHDALRHGEDVGDQAVEQVHGHCFADDDAQDFGRVFFGGEGVVWGWC
jgi:hypothetical protein